MDAKDVGMITEQGDLGLGFTKLSDEDAMALKESTKEGKDNCDEK